MHPEIYRDLVRERHADFDREAAKRSLVSIARAGGDPDARSASRHTGIGERLALAVRRRLRRVLLAAAAGVSLALAKVPEEGA